MGARKDRTRRMIVEAAYEAFYKDGFDRSGVDVIALAAGITKRTLYDHFASKDLLIAAVLDHQNDLVLERILRWADTETTTPKTFVTKLFDDLETWMATEDRWLGSGFTRAAMELASLPGHPARAAAKRHKAAIEGWMAARLEGLEHHDPKGLAAKLVVLLEGAMALGLIHQSCDHVGPARGAALALVAD